MVVVLSNYSRPHSGLDVLTLKCVTWCKSIIGCQTVQYMLSHSCAAITAATWRHQYFEWCIRGCFAIRSLKPITVPVAFVAEGSFNELCDPGIPRGVLCGINLPILLAMVKRVENLGRVMRYVAWQCHAERYHFSR